MRIAITGASGLLGTAVAASLRGQGHEVTRVVRARDAARAPDALFWRPDRREIDAAGLAGHDAVINLAGENIFGLWTPGRKERIRRSRIDGVSLLATTLRAIPEADRPRHFLLASAVGYYGDRPWNEPLTEERPPGDTFLARVLVDMEAAAAEARDAGVRVAILRFAPVVDPDGLLLRALALATRFGLGATIGSGRQPFPWVTRAEVASVVPFVLDRPALDGAINVAAPDRVSNAEFVDTVARVLNRPRFLKVPAPVVRLLGDFGRELLVAQWVVPARLEQAGYPWRDPALEPALRRMGLGDTGGPEAPGAA
jgi:uncharacterized protein